MGKTGKKRNCETKGHLEGESKVVGGGQQAGEDGGERGGHVLGVGGEGDLGVVVRGLVVAGVASDGGFDEEYVTYADVC